MDALGGFMSANVRTGVNINPNRTILHSDLNNFYASVECLYNPDLRNKPIAVCGEQSERHGIVLAKNDIAKRYGVKTAEAVWQAKQKCPDLVIVPPNYDRYMEFSQNVKAIYKEYSPCVESFGMDECWIDLTGCESLFGTGAQLADTIRHRVKNELGVTVSVGVSFNKVFAKLGSDMKKPNATTIIPYDGFREKIWSLCANELLFIGKSTYKCMQKYGIITIGDLANTEISFLKRIFGKNGEQMWYFANGLDQSPVQENDIEPTAKSIGNSTTTLRDMVTVEDAKIIIYKLSEKIAQRMRKADFYCKTIQIHIRENTLETHEFQTGLPYPTCCSTDIAATALKLFLQNRPEKPIRSLGIRATNLLQEEYQQLSYFDDIAKSQKLQNLEYSVDKLKAKYGNDCVKRGVFLLNSAMNDTNVQGIM